MFLVCPADEQQTADMWAALTRSVCNDQSNLQSLADTNVCMPVASRGRPADGGHVGCADARDLTVSDPPLYASFPTDTAVDVPLMSCRRPTNGGHVGVADARDLAVPPAGRPAQCGGAPSIWAAPPKTPKPQLPPCVAAEDTYVCTSTPCIGNFAALPLV